MKSVDNWYFNMFFKHNDIVDYIIRICVINLLGILKIMGKKTRF